MSKVAIVCAFDTYFDRVRMLRTYFEQKQDEVCVVTSDFSHRNKQSMKYLSGADHLVHAFPYSKNLSIQRLFSHYMLARNMKKKLEEIRPDVIYCLVPANSLAKMMAQYKREHPEVKLYFDVIDLWPEAMPIEKYLSLPPFQYWRKLRDKYLPAADQIFTECALYQDVLGQKDNQKFKTLYWARPELPCSFADLISEEEVHFVYLGSINNIIDIDFIVDFLTHCNQYKPSFLHIIGEGESKAVLVQKLEEAHVPVIDHKKVFEQEKKQAIFDQCNYALNIMKESVVVGIDDEIARLLVWRGADYQYDSSRYRALVEEFQIGFNIDRENLDAVAQRVCSTPLSEQFEQRENCRKVYQEFFRGGSFANTLKSTGL